MRMFLICILLFLAFPCIYSQTEGVEAKASSAIDSLYHTYSLSELLAFEVTSTSLSDIKDDLPLLPTVYISSEDISNCGARSLDEVLEIFVPGFYYCFKGNTGHALGFRGIISDRNNKILLLLNGKVMNNRSLGGVISERMLSMLGDIDHIEVIQSPQSSLYGPGAISAVISIYTKSNNDKNVDVELSQSFVNQYTNLQVSHGRELGNDISYFAYYGVDYAPGVDPVNSPTKLSFNTVDAYGDTIISDSPISYPTKNLFSNHANEASHKLHGEIKYKDFSIWARLTKGGRDFDTNQKGILSNYSTRIDSLHYRYKHYSIISRYQRSMKKLSVDASLGFDQMHTGIMHEPAGTDYTPYSFKENEVYARALLKYSSEKMRLALGPALSLERFGMPAFGAPREDYRIENFYGSDYEEGGADSVNAYALPWSTLMWSGLFEAQYLPTQNLSFFGGLRVDKHTYTDAFYSPRIGVVYKHKNNHLIRLNYSISNRRAEDVDLRYEFLLSGRSTGDVERISFTELSGEFILGEYFAFSPSLYRGVHHIQAWIWSQMKSDQLGSSEYYGAELSLKYINEKLKIICSQNYTKLLSLQLMDIDHTPGNNVSTAPYGYGSDFHNFPNHLTKIYLNYRCSRNITFNTSLMANYGHQGMIDAANYNVGVSNAKITGPINTGSNDFAGMTMYWHAGLSAPLINRLSASLYLYNITALMDENLSKKIEFQRSSQYRIIPFSLSLKLHYQFL